MVSFDGHLMKVDLVQFENWRIKFLISFGCCKKLVEIICGLCHIKN